MTYTYAHQEITIASSSFVKDSEVKCGLHGLRFSLSREVLLRVLLFIFTFFNDLKRKKRVTSPNRRTI